MNTFEMVFVGQRIGQKDKKIYGWMDPKTEEVSYYEKPLAPASIGGIYKFTRPEGKDDTFYSKGPNGPKYSGKWINREQAIKWNIKDDEARQYFAAKTLEKKVAKDPNEEPIEHILRGLKILSNKLTATERLALVAKLTEAVLLR